MNTKVYVAALVIAACSLQVSAQQKSFLVNSHDNPLKSFSIPSNKESHPFFVDIDHDGDLDCFSGEFSAGQPSKIYFYRNDGSSKTPLFKQVSGVNNPLNKVAANTLTIPYFVDIDGDGDYDCFIGEGTTGAIIYYKNIGTATTPQFQKQSAATNPLAMVKFLASGVANPAFADVDGDGDYDCLVVDEEGNEHFLRNTGTAKNPAFSRVASGDDPFKPIVPMNGLYNVSFEDWDHDGLVDVFVNTTYYKNIGTKAKPIFAINNGENRPVFQNKSADEFSYTPLRWVDLHGDGNREVFQGSVNGSFVYQTVSSDNAVAPAAGRTASVYPNPSKEAFVLNVPGAISAGTAVRLSDVQGKLLMTQSLSSSTLKFGKELKPGTYFVQILQDSKVIYTKKVIKQ